MTGLTRFFCASLAAHLALWCGLPYLAFWDNRQAPPLMVDFTLESSLGGPASSPSSPGTPRMSTRKPASPSQRSHNTATGIPDAAPPVRPSLPVAVAISRPDAATMSSTAAISPTAVATAGQVSPGNGSAASHSLLSSGETRSSAERGRGNSSGQSSGDTGHGGEQAAYLREQFTYIRDTVMRQLTYPGHARRMGWSGKVVLSFIVVEDGSVHELKIRKDSGIPILDKGAVDAVMRAAPFPRPSARVEVVLPITYRLL